MTRKYSKLKVCVVWFFISCFVAPIHSTDTLSVTLEQCLQMANDNNNSLHNAELDLMAAKAQRQELLVEYFPKISVNAFGFWSLDPLIEIGVKDVLGASDFSNNLQYVIDQIAPQLGVNSVYRTMQRGGCAVVSVVQPVFAGGRIVNGNKLAGLGVQAAELQKSITERVTLEDVERNYWYVVSLEEKRLTLLQLADMLDTIRNNVSDAYNAGLVTVNDLMQIKLKQNELRSGLIQIEHGIRLAKMNLLNSINFEYAAYYDKEIIDSIPYIDNIVFSDRLASLKSPIEYYVDEKDVIAKQEESMLLELAVEAKKTEKNMIIGETLPQVAVGASYGYSNFIDRGDMNGSVYVMVNIPLSDWGKNAKKIQRYNTQINKAENEREYLTSQIELQIRQLWFNLITAWQQLEVAGESVKTAEASVNQLISYYNAGLSPLSELLQAQTQLRQAKESQIEQQINYRNALQAYLNRVNK